MRAIILVVMVNSDGSNQLDCLREVIQLGLGVVGGILGGLPKIHEWLSRPLLKVSKCKISRFEGGPRINHNEFGEEFGIVEDNPSVVISWCIQNKKRCCFFGRAVTNLQTTWNLKRKSDEMPRARWNTRDRMYCGKVDPILLVPLGPELTQEATLPDPFLGSGVYVLTLNISSEEKIIHTDSKIIKV